MRRAALFIAALAVAAGVIMLLFSMLMREKPAEIGQKLSVSASFYPLAHFAQKAGGPGIEVFMVTPPGAESHDFEPTPRDIKRITESDVFIYNGAGLDPWAERIIPSLHDAGVVTVGMASHFKLMTVEHEEHEDAGDGHAGEGFDPHIWLDPSMAAGQVKVIGKALTAADPANAPVYRALSGQYSSELMALDEEFKKGLSDCASRDIIVAHDAFGYLGKRYNLNIIPVTGVFSGEEPSPRRIAEVTRLARDKSIRYIFFEPLQSPKIASIIAREAGAEVLALNPVEGLTKEEEASGKDYISVMRENLANLRKALSCR